MNDTDKHQAIIERAKLDIALLEDALEPVLTLARSAHGSAGRASEAIGERHGTGAAHACLALMEVALRALNQGNDAARYSRHAMSYPTTKSMNDTDKPSDTPRSDAAACEAVLAMTEIQFRAVPLSFARELERENNALRVERDALTEQLRLSRKYSNEHRIRADELSQRRDTLAAQNTSLTEQLKAIDAEIYGPKCAPENYSPDRAESIRAFKKLLRDTAELLKAAQEQNARLREALESVRTKSSPKRRSFSSNETSWANVNQKEIFLIADKALSEPPIGPRMVSREEAWRELRQWFTNRQGCSWEATILDLGKATAALAAAQAELERTKNL